MSNFWIKIRLSYDIACCKNILRYKNIIEKTVIFLKQSKNYKNDSNLNKPKKKNNKNTL